MLLYNELPKGQAVSLQRQAKIPAKSYASLQHEDGSQWLCNLCNQFFLRSAVNRQTFDKPPSGTMILSPYLAFFNGWPALWQLSRQMKAHHRKDSGGRTVQCRENMAAGIWLLAHV